MVTPEDVLPFAGSDSSPPPSAAPQLNLEHWASLVAELYRDPAARAATLHRYHLDEASYAAHEARFRALFVEDPGQYGRFRALYDQYANWLSGR